MKPAYEKLAASAEDGIHCNVFRGNTFGCVWHCHVEYEITLVLKARGHRLVGDNLTSLKPGDMVLVGVPASLATRRIDIDALIVGLRSAWLEGQVPSVSLDPPLVLWSAARASARFSIYAAAKAFSIHILGEDDAALSARFIRGGAGFDGLATTLSAGGSPVIPQTLARFDCHQHSVHDGGDHLIIIGRVTHFAMRHGAPLVFSQGTYGSFVAQP